MKKYKAMFWKSYQNTIVNNPQNLKTEQKGIKWKMKNISVLIAQNN